jgi:hypothetical protein
MPANLSAVLSPTLPRSQGRRSGVIGAWLISSAFLALGLSFLPIGPGTSSASVINPSSGARISIGRTISNSALKGDRLPDSRRGAGQRMESSKPASIPVGCEAAFSKLVRVGNFTSRCVT